MKFNKLALAVTISMTSSLVAAHGHNHNHEAKENKLGKVRISTLCAKTKKFSHLISIS